MKVLIFDVDSGLRTNINHEPTRKMVEEIPPIKIADGPRELMSIVGQFARRNEEVVKHPVAGDLKVNRIVTKPEFKESGVKAIVIDTGSTLATQGRIRIARDQAVRAQKPVSTMDQKGWGIHGDEQARLYNFIGHWEDMTVIVNMHVDDVKDDESGRIEWLPAIKGGTKTQVHNYFDAVLFTSVDGTIEDKENPERYRWLAAPKRGHIAGIRAVDLPDVLPQDYQILLDAFHNAGIHDPKILILGPSKTGKTFALRTLVEYEYPF
jgi:hypothetical protein